VVCSQSYRILAVDDVDDNLLLLQTLLESEGYTVDVANSGRMALEKIQTTPPDLVLLDVMMPDMNGYEVTQHIRENQRCGDLPILLISAHDEVRLEQGVAAGANDFIRKPLDFNRLLSRIGELTARSNE
jgi:CheY-like chemotaxis protein